MESILQTIAFVLPNSHQRLNPFQPVKSKFHTHLIENLYPPISFESQLLAIGPCHIEIYIWNVQQIVIEQIHKTSDITKSGRIFHMINIIHQIEDILICTVPTFLALHIRFIQFLITEFLPENFISFLGNITSCFNFSCGSWGVIRKDWDFPIFTKFEKVHHTFFRNIL